MHIIVAYTNICLKSGTMLHRVPYININLTFTDEKYFHNLVKNLK